MKSNYFKNKKIWITGASSGIGEHLAYGLSRQGARLILSARNKNELNRVAGNCGPPKDQIAVLPLDLEKVDALAPIGREAVEIYGGLDMLINNGGISQRSLVMDTSLQVDRRIMNIDYLGQVALTKAILPTMLAAGSGHIVVVSSLTGKIATPLRSSYCAAKHALHGFFNSLRMEVHQDNIKVTIVCPASITTNVSLNALAGDGNKYGKMDERQAGGMSAEKCARRIIRALKKGREEIDIGPPVIYAALVKRLFPGLYSKAVRRARVT